MDRPRYRWEWTEADAAAEAALAEALRLPRLVARLLVARGLTTPEEAHLFLEAGEEAFHDPWSMKGMGEAVERIRKALRDGERLLVYGDYDADGVCASALMIRLLRRLDAAFDVRIPNRLKEGYGLNREAIDRAAEDGFRLIVTVDNGVSAVEEIAYARERGIDVVVTDHHEPPAVLPEAVALVNPKRPDCPYPFKGLSGAGVAYKLAHALLGRHETEFADLAAIGTVADLMPLVDENRALVRIGLMRLREAASPGLRALAEACGFDPAALSSGRIAFGLAPRLNAGGRLESADGAVRLLVTEREEEAAQLARELDRLNRERQQLVERTLAEAEERIAREAAGRGGVPPLFLTVADASWNPGVVGLVAAKLAEKYTRPALVLAEDAETGLCRGSARSVGEFDMHAALTACADLLEHFGGHRAAAGLTVRKELLGELAARLEALAEERLTPEDRIPRKKADVPCTADELTLEAAEQLAKLEPFGQDNPAPTFVLRDAVVRSARAVGADGKHLKLTLQQNGHTLEAIGFDMGGLLPWLAPGVSVDLLGTATVSEWQGVRQVQFQIKDIRYAGLQVLDRRRERLTEERMAELLETIPDGCALVCDSVLEAEKWRRRLPEGVPVASYADLAAAFAAAEAGRAGADEIAAARAPFRAVRHLVLSGLPEGGTEADAAARLLAGMDHLAAVHVHAGTRLPGAAPEADRGVRNGTAADRDMPDRTVPDRGMPDRIASGRGTPDRTASDRVKPDRTAPNRGVPDRAHFAEAYALFRAKGAWPDEPDGFLREVSARIGWPLPVVRVMQDVFEELGFLRVENGWVTMEPSPAKRELAESARYREARWRWTGERLAGLPAEALAEWMRQARRME